MECFFDLLAELIAWLEENRKKIEIKPITEKTEAELVKKADALMEKYSEYLWGAARKGLPTEIYHRFLEEVVDENNYHFHRILLCRLECDGRTDLQKEIRKRREDGFSSLNQNTEFTKLLLLPKVTGPKITYSVPDKDAPGGMTERERKLADAWTDNLNTRLNHIYYILREDLGDWEIRNYLPAVEMEDPSVAEMTVAFAPLTNLPMDAVLKYDLTATEKDQQGNEYALLDILGVQDPRMLQERILDMIRLAGDQDVDILIFPEMLGVETFYQIDRYGFNPLLRKLCKEVRGRLPKLILMPSYWAENRNRVWVYTDEGKLLCEQVKQNAYVHQERYRENLRDTPKVISIIHVPGWGRLTIPICFDFLQEDYRRRLVTALKSDFLLCPSYSGGTENFLRALDAYSEYGTRVIWGDACSAVVRKEQPVPRCVGAACEPVVAPDPSVIRFCPQCDGSCERGCLFLVKIPLKEAGIRGGRRIRVEQVFH